MAMQYVGSVAGSGTGASYNLDLTALTGGIDTAARANDIVVVVSGWASTTDDDPGVSTSGYTELTDLRADDTRDANLSVAYKVMGGTPDTSVTVLGKNNAANGGAAIAHVWRGVDTSNPIDQTTTTASSANSAIPDSPSITPVTNGAVILTCGISTGDSNPTSTSGRTLEPPVGYINEKVQVGTGSTMSAIAVVASRFSPASAINPGPWENVGESTSSDSWCAATVALRPAVDTGGGTFNAPGRWLCPAGVTSIEVEVWGSGGGGGGNPGVTSQGGGGGGGGAYSKKTVTVTPGTTYNFYAGSAGGRGIRPTGSNGGDGEDSWFNTAAEVMAKGGLGGSASNTGGTGGASASGVGTTKFSGGTGGTGGTGSGQNGGGGGSSGGTGANGNNGSQPTGGAAVTGGGAGANGSSGSGNCVQGSTPGGGGGGSTHWFGENASAGGPGQVKITVPTVVNSNMFLMFQ